MEKARYGIPASIQLEWKKYYLLSSIDLNINGQATGLQNIAENESHALAFNPDDNESIAIINLQAKNLAELVEDASLRKGDVNYDTKKNLLAAKMDSALKDSGMLGATVGAGVSMEGVGMDMSVAVRKYDCKGDTIRKTLVCDVDFTVKTSMTGFGQ